ncbi:MAG: S41 family peptidase [Candidatus Curtissbacteria bacterium]
MPDKFKPFSSKQSSGITNFLIQFFLIGVIFFALGFALGQKKVEIDKKSFVPNITFTNQTPPSAQSVDFSLFWKVYETLPGKYLDKTAIDGQKILHGAISGMVKSLGDPYTAFLDPKQNQAVTEELAGSYQGVGIQIGFNKEKRLVVIAPLAGTPAEAAGIRAKDLILKIGDRDTFDITLPEAVDLIRGSAGTKVQLTLMRDGEDKPYEKELERAQINVKSVELEYKDSKKGKIAVIRVSRFGETTDGEWDKAVSDVLAANPYGVIVDMRNNPGGLLASGIHVTSEFVGGTVVKQETSDGTVTSLGVDHSGKLLSIPMGVLVNGGSASAAEIFSGAIADNNRGKLVGEKTFGKGSVQDVVPFPGGSSLHVTFAKWLTPKGTSIHDVGITPDVIIEAGDATDGEDPQLSKALELF